MRDAGDCLAELDEQPIPEDLLAWVREEWFGFNLRVPPNPDLYRCEPAIDFGEVAHGSPVTRTLLIRNTGKRPAVVSFDEVLGKDGCKPKEGKSSQYAFYMHFTHFPFLDVGRVCIRL